jgi:hypothetical protein
MNPTHCRYCGDDLPADAPPGVDTCREYARWRARQAGDMLPRLVRIFLDARPAAP